MDECRSCNANIFWGRTRNDKSIPIDAEPTPDGNLTLEEKPYVRVHGNPAAIPAETIRYTSHFVTCPNRATWRRS